MSQVVQMESWRNLHSILLPVTIATARLEETLTMEDMLYAAIIRDVIIEEMNSF